MGNINKGGISIMDKKNFKRIVTFLLAIVMVITIAPTSPVFAKKASDVNKKSLISLTGTSKISTSKYDVTGDGKADKLVIKCNKFAYDMGEGIKVIVNGKTLYSDKNDYFYNIYAKICTLSSGKVLVYIYNPADNGDSYLCGLYDLSGKKMKCVLDMNRMFSKNGYHVNGDVSAVSGNKITVHHSQQNYCVAGMAVNFTYKYSKGKLVLDKKESTNYQIWAGRGAGNKELTAAKTITVYKKATSSAKAFTLKRGNKVKVVAVCSYKGNLYFKVKKGNKTGYIKCITGYPKDGNPLFKNAEFAG